MKKCVETTYEPDTREYIHIHKTKRPNVAYLIDRIEFGIIICLCLESNEKKRHIKCLDAFENEYIWAAMRSRVAVEKRDTRADREGGRAGRSEERR